MPQGKTVLIAIVCFFFTLHYASAQLSESEQENSPYSYFGPGNLSNVQLPEKRSMGGVGIASSSNRYVNLVNPAALGSLKYASFHTGLFANAYWLSENNSSNENNTSYSFNSSLEYLILGLPITKWWGSSIGLLPYSSTNYNLIREVYEGEPTDTANLNIYNFQGSGTYYKFQWANGFTSPITKTGFFKENQIAFGLNTDFYFGNRDITTTIYKPNIENVFNLKETQSLRLSDFGFYGGLLYKRYFYKKINTDAKVAKEEVKNILAVGLTFQSKTSLNAKRDYVLEQLLTNGANPIQTLDTIGEFLDRAEATMTLPSEFGIGINYGQPGSWQVEANFKQINWSQYNDYRNIELANAYKISIGTQFTPKRNNSIRKRINTISYRFGGYYYSNHILTNNTNLPDFGLTFGLGAPILNSLKFRRIANINLAFKIGNRGNIQDNNLRETYFKTTIGITFNDGNWFIKRRYE